MLTRTLFCLFSCVGLGFLAIVIFASNASHLNVRGHVDTSIMEDQKKPGVLAAKAVIERLQTGSQQTAFGAMMGYRRSVVLHEKRPLIRDPYLPWLAAMFAQSASAGRLFVSEQGKIFLMTSFETGDSLAHNTVHTFYYLGVVTVFESDGASRMVADPWLLWKYLGSQITPSHPDDRPFEEKILLSSVAPGDLVQLDIYRVHRNKLADYDKSSVAKVISDGSASLVIRLPLPVVVPDDGAGPSR